jgi:hypothetical protein
LSPSVSFGISSGLPPSNSNSLTNPNFDLKHFSPHVDTISSTLKDGKDYSSQSPLDDIFNIPHSNERNLNTQTPQASKTLSSSYSPSLIESFSSLFFFNSFFFFCSTIEW